jgi:hypothetical protein
MSFSLKRADVGGSLLSAGSLDSIPAKRVRLLRLTAESGTASELRAIALTEDWFPLPMSWLGVAQK